MSKIAVLGNCQAAGFAASLRVWMPDATVQAKSGAMLISEGAEKNRAFMDFLSECDYIFLQDMFSSKHINAEFIANISVKKKIIIYPRIIYTGNHPDCIYVYEGDNYIRTPMGQYNSALGLAGFLEGLSVQRTSRLFNKYSFSRLGYLDIQSRSKKILSEKLKLLGYSIDGFLNSAFMHTINHPKIELLHSLAQQAIDMAGLARRETGECPPDSLAKNVIWPVYADLQQGENYAFRAAGRTLDDREMSLEAFLEGSFEAYSTAGVIPVAPLAEKARAFIRQDVIL